MKITKIGAIATLIGLTILIAIGLYYAVIALFLSEDVHLIYKIAISLVAIGIITIFVGMIRENIKNKSDSKDIIAAFKNLVGGEITEYTQLLGQSREEALSRMISKAEDMDANAVINLRFMTSMVSAAASEILAYGTAVVVEEE